MSFANIAKFADNYKDCSFAVCSFAVCSFAVCSFAYLSIRFLSLIRHLSSSTSPAMGSIDLSNSMILCPTTSFISATINSLNPALKVAVTLGNIHLVRSSHSEFRIGICSVLIVIQFRHTQVVATKNSSSSQTRTAR